MACSDVQNLYAGDGVTTDFAFTFEYLQQSDVKVALFNSTTEVWDDTLDFTFETATTIRFNSAPPAPPAGVTENVKIYRETALTNLKAVFAAGSAIRAQDLNDNFEQLFFASQELECYGGGGGIAGGSIDDLVDVNIDNPTDGQILEYDGNNWVNVDWHQGDWNETDVNSPSFIQNKPEGGLVYLGLRDCVANNPVGTEIAGNFYVNIADGNASNGWTGIAGDLIENNDRIVLDNDGVTWSRLSVGNSDQPTGGGLDEIFYENGQTVNNDYTLTAGTNAGTFGVVTVDAVVTVPDGSSWTIVGSNDGTDPAGFWERDGTTLSPANDGDDIETTGDVTAGNGGAILGLQANTASSGALQLLDDADNVNIDMAGTGSASFSESISVGEDADWATAGVGVRRSDSNWGIIAAHDESQDTASALLIASGTTPTAGEPIRIQINHNGLGGPGTSDVYSVGWTGNVTMGKSANAGNGVRGVRFIQNNFNPLQSIDVASGGGSEVVFQINLNGTPTYRLNGNGTTVTRGVAIELDPDNPANYVSTTNADGETESVYNGPVLDVKESIRKMQAALYRLKAAVLIPDTTVDQLRLRILEALENITEEVE